MTTRNCAKFRKKQLVFTNAGHLPLEGWRKEFVYKAILPLKKFRQLETRNTGQPCWRKCQQVESRVFLCLDSCSVLQGLLTERMDMEGIVCLKLCSIPLSSIWVHISTVLRHTFLNKYRLVAAHTQKHNSRKKK